MKHFTFCLAALICSGFLFSGCMVSGGLIIETEPIVAGSKHAKYEKPHRAANHYRKKRNKSVRVPPGHLPPKGMCRIWFDNRPPGHQPPPGNCRELRRMVPYNAVLIYG
jgi:hypothetical protein